MRAIAVLLALHLVASVIGFVLLYQQLLEVNQRLSRLERGIETTNTQISTLGRALVPFAPSAPSQ